MTEKQKRESEKAIALLEEHKNKLLNHSFTINYPWATKTGSLVMRYFGADSYEYQHACQAGIQGLRIKEEFIQFLDDCKQTIKENGVYKKPAVNILSHMNNWTVLSVAATIIITSFGAGVALGEKLSDKQNYELKIENKELKDSLSFKK